MDLTGKVALVTGAGSGMGRAIAQSLAEEGCKVVAVGRTESKLKETVATYKGTGSITIKPADVSNNDEVVRLVESVTREIGPIDILVNNAGINVRARKMAELSLESWNQMLQVNLTGPFNTIKAVLPGMRERGGGLIINISSVAGKRASVLGGAGYSASKFGLNALSGVLAQEEADHGIRSTVICPGEVNTPILDERPVPVSAERKAIMLQPEDIAAAVLFVAKLPPRAHIPELIIKPTNQPYA